MPVVRTASHGTGRPLRTGTEIHAVAPVGLNPHGIVIVP